MPAFCLGLIVFLFAGAMIWRHRRVRRNEAMVSDEEAAFYGIPGLAAATREFEAEFAASQYRRRLQTTALMALVGILMMLSPLVGDPWIALALWLGVLLLLGGVILLAMLDYLNTKAHFEQLQAHYRAEQAALQAKLKELPRHGSNGHR